MSFRRLVHAIISKSSDDNIYREMATLRLTQKLMREHPVQFARAISLTERQADELIINLIQNNLTTVYNVQNDAKSTKNSKLFDF